MHKFKLKPDLMEKISAARQEAKWETDVAIRIAESKEKAKDEDVRDMSHIRVYTDGSGLDGQI